MLTYVDDLLLAGSKEVIAALATAIQGIWKNDSSCTCHCRVPVIRFLGVEIRVQGSGFVLSQEAYAEELLRLNSVRRVSRETKSLGQGILPRAVGLTDESPTEESVRTAQRLTGEILWLSQRTRPDLAFTACVLAERAARIASQQRALHSPLTRMIQD